MNKEFNIDSYLTNGVEKIIKEAIKATMKNPRQSIYFTKYALYSKKATKIRCNLKEQGEHIPPFLIASITSSCNLHCAGCYSRANHACFDENAVTQLSASDWGNVFKESRDLGIGFILLAGGEPMMRRDVIQEATRYPEILFPIFTNGTMFDKEYIKLFDANRNLVPVISLEGQKQKTDLRRGEGVYQKVMNSICLISQKQLAFGVSVTLTTENLQEVTSDAFLRELKDIGAKVVFYVEYVPVTEASKHLAPGEMERALMKAKLSVIREQYQDTVFISFPGDEKTSGGCLAAGRGFFHINYKGGAEPCPFSPYSDINVKEASVREALHSRLFNRLQKENVLLEEHAGGCVLFERRETVERLLK